MSTFEFGDRLSRGWTSLVLRDLRERYGWRVWVEPDKHNAGLYNVRTARMRRRFGDLESAVSYARRLRPTC